MKAFLVDTDAWLKLTAMEPRPPEEDSSAMRMYFNPYWSGIPIIRSPYIMHTSDYDSPRITKDFDRWFRVTLFTVEDRKQREAERRVEQSRDAAML